MVRIYFCHQNPLTHTDDDDAGGFDTINTIGGFAFIVTSVVCVNIRDA